MTGERTDETTEEIVGRIGGTDSTHGSGDATEIDPGTRDGALPSVLEAPSSLGPSVELTDPAKRGLAASPSLGGSGPPENGDRVAQLRLIEQEDHAVFQGRGIRCTWARAARWGALLITSIVVVTLASCTRESDSQGAGAASIASGAASIASGVSSAAGVAAASGQDLLAQMESLNTALGQTNSLLGRINGTMRETNRLMSHLNQSMGQMNKLMNEMNGSMNEMNQSLSQMLDAIQSAQANASRHAEITNQRIAHLESVLVARLQRIEAVLQSRL